MNIPSQDSSKIGATVAAGCNICDVQLVDGVPYQPAMSRNANDYKFRDGQLIDYLCPKCSSRSRLRTFDIVLRRARHFRLGDQKAFLVSAGRFERDLVARAGYSVTHASLHGSHGDENCLTGVDVAAMPQIPSVAFDFFLAVNVFDYIPDLERVFGEIHRILRPDGWLLFFIQPQRLVDGEAAPIIQHRNALAHESYAPSGEVTGIPDCRFSKGWLKTAGVRMGLRIETYDVMDPLSQLPITWFFGQPLRASSKL